MSAGWTAILTSLAYVSILFAVAHYGDRSQRAFANPKMRALIYALGLCIYCTSWTFFGSVGLASSSGLDFLPVYIGPILVIGFGHSLIARIVNLSKTQNITSVADFLAARYGKSESVAAIVAIIAVIGVVPYIALQLKAIAASLAIVSAAELAPVPVMGQPGSGAVTLAIAIILAVFAMAFGTRRIEATEHQDGLMLAIAVESMVKLAAFLAVGAFVTWGSFGGLGDLMGRLAPGGPIARVFLHAPDPLTWVTITFLSACAVLLLPRQFHVAIVENRNERDAASAAWLFPLYLVAINLFVVPLAIAGLSIFPDGAIDRDMTVLALPLQANSSFMALVAMLGGFSAATAMVVMSSVALSIMVSNDLVIPLMLRLRAGRSHLGLGDLASRILVIRRFAIASVIILSCVYLRIADNAALASIGLMSFAAIAQIAPAFVAALFWPGANARGARAGMIIGLGLWAYTLLLPSLNQASPVLADIVANGPWGLALLKPTALLGFDLPVLAHGVLFSLLANIAALAGLSLTRQATPIERLQASIFVAGSAAPAASGFGAWRSNIQGPELESIVARYLGAERARNAFADFSAMQVSGGASPASTLPGEADIHAVRFAEQALASVIGTASSRLVLALALRRSDVSRQAALQLVDEASAAIQYNRTLLQHAFDFAKQGITVFDSDLRLVFWNREFRDIFDYPPEITRIGVSLAEMVRFNARRGHYGPGSVEDFVTARMEVLTESIEPFRLALQDQGGTIEMRSSRMPDGGLVITYTDVTDQVEAEQALAAIIVTLEQRVRERSEELVALNAELARAKAEAEQANMSKTRFLAAASHDILQPLNAARLFATALAERMPGLGDGPPAARSEAVGLARNVDASLESVEEILTALLDMSRLDAGAMKAELTPFHIDDILGQLRIEFEPLAREKNLKLTFAPCGLTVRSDRRLLRRLLQNLVSNAIKYTQTGRVLVGARRSRSRLRIEIWDTGLGIPEGKRKAVFREFERLDAGARNAPGLGLGLSIVERLARVLGHKITLRSVLGRGSCFSVEVPLAPKLPASLQISPDASSQPHYLPLSGMVVVAIDNEPRILEGMTVLLGGWGCQVIPAGSLKVAELALAAAKAVPQAIIADYHLDDIGGIETIVALRWKFGMEIPAILLTADRSQSVRLEADAKDIKLLNKPLKPAALRALLAQWRMSKVAAE